LVGTSYKNWFIRQFSDNDDLFSADLVDYSGMDYLDICDYVDAKTKMVYKYMSRLDGKESGFVSSKTDESFKSIYYQAINIESVMLEKLRAYVLENSISKDRNAYVGRLGFKNVFLYFEELEQASHNRNALTAISMFEDDMARIVLVPTYDLNYQFYMSETRIGIDDYAEDARVNANAKNSTRNRIAINNHKMDQLMRSDELYAQDAKAEELVKQITAELDRVCGKARTIAREFFAWEANGYISLTVSSMESNIKGIIKSAVKWTAFLLAGFVCAYLAEAYTLFFKRPDPQRERSHEHDNADDSDSEQENGKKRANRKDKKARIHRNANQRKEDSAEP